MGCSVQYIKGQLVSQLVDEDGKSNDELTAGFIFNRIMVSFT